MSKKMTAMTVLYVLLVLAVAAGLGYLIYWYVMEMQKNKPVTKDMVKSWVSSVLTGASQECYDCVAAFGAKNWSMDAFNKLKMKSKTDQQNVARAVVMANCQKQCASK